MNSLKNPHNGSIDDSLISVIKNHHRLNLIVTVDSTAELVEWVEFDVKKLQLLKFQARSIFAADAKRKLLSSYFM